MITVEPPYKAITLGISNVRSYWLAAHNPIVFKCMRQDTPVNFIHTIPQHPGRVYVAVPLTVPLTEVGKQIRVVMPLYTGTYTVGDVRYGSNNGIQYSYLWIQGATYKGNDTGYANFLSRANFRVEFDVVLLSRATNYPIDTVKVTRTPSINGEFTLDVSGVLKNYLVSKNTRNYSSALINEADDNLYGAFRLALTQYWDNQTVTVGQVVASGAAFRFVHAAMQIGTSANMLAYVPLIGKASLSSTKPDVSNNAKFLSKFAIPTYWSGWPFDLSFIYSEYMYGHDLERLIVQKNINATTITGVDNKVNLAGIEAVNRLSIGSGYSSGVAYLDVHLRIKQSNQLANAPGQMMPGKFNNIIKNNITYNPSATRGYSIAGYLAGNYTRGITYIANDLIVTETKRLKVEHCEVKNPFYLCWLNTLGGFEYYMFQYNQIKKIQTSTESEYGQYWNDLDTVERESFDLQNEAVNSYQLGADGVDKQHIDALQDLLASPVVYKMEQDGTRTRVRVKKGSFNVYETNEEVSEVRLEVLMPELQIQVA